MKLHSLETNKNSVHNRKRVGRGSSSGTGKTSGRGQKGQNARSGGGTRPGFEGGQMPLFRRIPKFGFTSPNQKKYVILNLDDIERLGLKEISHQTLLEKKLISTDKVLIKVLGNGEITKPVKIKVNKISKNAQTKIEAAQGSVQKV